MGDDCADEAGKVPVDVRLQQLRALRAVPLGQHLRARADGQPCGVARRGVPVVAWARRVEVLCALQGAVGIAGARRWASVLRSVISDAAAGASAAPELITSDSRENPEMSTKASTPS